MPEFELTSLPEVHEAQHAKDSIIDLFSGAVGEHSRLGIAFCILIYKRTQNVPK